MLFFIPEPKEQCFLGKTTFLQRMHYITITIGPVACWLEFREVMVLVYIDYGIDLYWT